MMNFKNELARDFYEEIKRLRDERDAELDRVHKITMTAYDMEGKYGHAVTAWYDIGQGLRGYHYEYDTEELHEKEETEIKKYLEDNNWRYDDEIYEEYDGKIEHFENLFNLQQYGMTTEEKLKADRIEAQKKHIKKLEKKLEKEREYLAELERAE